MIDPQLNWKKASKGSNKRAGRRARASFASSNKKKSALEDFTKREEAVEKDEKECMPVSESEKLGVSILGRRFSNMIESVPIKKRRFFFPYSSESEPPLMLFSSSPPRESNANSNVECQASSSSSWKNLKTCPLEDNQLENTNKKLGDDADFSGISILAAAACNSSIGLLEEAVSSRLNDVPLEKHLISSVGISNNKFDDSSLGGISDQALNNDKLVGRKMDSGSVCDAPNKEDESVRRSETSSRDDRLHWDLNTTMESWENPYDDSFVKSLSLAEGCSVGGVETVGLKDLKCHGVQMKPVNTECVVQTKAEVLSSSPKGDHGSLLPKASEKSEYSFDQGTQIMQKECTSVSVSFDQISNLGLAHSETPDHVMVSTKENPSLHHPENPAICLETGSCLVELPVAHEEGLAFVSPSSVKEEASPVHPINNSLVVETACDKSHLVFNDANDPTTVYEPRSIASETACEENEVALSSGDVHPRNLAHAVTLKIVEIEDVTGHALDQKKEVDEKVCLLGTQDETAIADMKIQGNKCSKLDDVNMSAAVNGETGIPLCVDIKDAMCNSASKTPEMVDMKTLAGASSSHEACKSSADDHVISSGEVALGDPSYGEYDSDASQNDPDQVNGIEEVGRLQLADDDYQYEDGEFRESLLHTWEDDCEEGEAEPVDYGSDNQEIVAFDTSADYYAPAPVHSERGECQEERFAKADHGINIVMKGEQSTHRSCLLDSAKPDLSDSGSSRKRVVNLERKVSRGHLAVSDKLEIDGKDSLKFTENDHLAVQDGIAEDDHSLRMKSSGWDQMPEGVHTSEEGINAAGINGLVRDDIGTVLDVGKPMRTVGPRLARDLSSRIERLKSPDMLLEKDREFGRGSRSHNSDGSNDRIRRDATSCRSTGRGGPTLQRHVRGREGDHWLDSPRGHWGPNRRGSPGFYGPSSFSRSGTNDAAAAATAKLESSGFVITPDGTLVKAGASIMGPGNRLHRHSPQGTYRSRTRRGSPPIDSDRISFSMRSGLGRGREMSPDRQFSVGHGRSGRYGTRGRGGACRVRYNGPLLADDIDSSVHIHDRLSSRERSLSPNPRREHLRRSGTRSPSRSRTRSPHMWGSPRGRGSGGFSVSARVRRRSRSPENFRAEARMERMRSPHGRPGFGEHMINFMPALRNHVSLSHASRYIDDRKELPSDHFRQNGYKRSSDRSPSRMRMFSRNSRYDSGSPGRLKPDEYYSRPMNSGRYPEFVGVGMRHEGSEEDRRHGERYGMLNTTRQFGTEGDMKRFPCDEEDGFRAHHSRSKDSPEFHVRGSPRGFDRGFNGELGDLPRRAREEKTHFRYGRHGNQNAGFKQFDIREGDEDEAQKRRA
ncbi:hypothetical protein QJS04_geneDACA000897 [Acorus gramineus]|uniref:Uncharacterized protein n=1 Tax=Acorus gramineus TaxID=55184 RepID=A0AAV9ABY3_ACOGR|nr:hypothetical protein QJS04_geneDACA000897 [Acorus gramineus]